jgi:hypothetical protein
MTPKMEEALRWCYATGERRWFAPPVVGSPAAASMTALVNRGLAKKTGGNGWPARYTLTDEGRKARAELEARP